MTVCPVAPMCLNEDGSEYPGDSIKITGTSPFDPYPYPFNFDARYKPHHPELLQHGSNVGVRGRASLPNIPFLLTRSYQTGLHLVYGASHH